MMSQPVYLDGMATTSVDERVVETMIPYLHQISGNPSSRSHAYGWEAESAVKLARQTVADAINAEPRCLIWTSGGTESNNLAIKGVAESCLQKGRHIVTVKTEHSAVLEPCRYLESLGFEVTYLDVNADGLIHLNSLENTLRPDTILVSVMAANNETGILQPTHQIGAICRDRKILFHVDAAQAVGKIPIDVKAAKIDLLTATAHKIYGPKGSGVLFFRKGAVRLAPQLHGGAQEGGVRSGTLPTHQIVGFAKALELAVNAQVEESKRLLTLRERLWNRLQSLADINLNGHPTQRLPHCLSVSFGGVDSAALMLGVRSTIAVSSGSACASGSQAPSHVLTAMGREAQLAKATLRFGLGRFNTETDIELAAQTVLEVVTSLREHETPAAGFS
ncbi:MAG: aminotransferase class V-fold PLP-dependent enzyme [Cyanobacteria bacterium P01_F01_bin.42]